MTAPRDRERASLPSGPKRPVAAPHAMRSWLRRTSGELRRRFLTPQVWITGAGHLAVFAFVYWLAFFVRFALERSDFELPAGDFRVFTHTLLLVLVCKFSLFLLLGHFEGWWAYVTFADLIALIRTSVLAMLAIVALSYLAGQDYFIPRSVLILDCGATIGLIGLLRGSQRLYREHFWPIFSQGEYRWALLVGTDHSSRMLAHQIQSSGELPYRIRGFLATEDAMPGARLGQIPVLGRLEDLREIAISCKATDVLVTAGTLPGSQLRLLMNLCEQEGLDLKIIRRLEDRLGGDQRIPIRDIEISDLLRRAPVQLDTKTIGKLLENRTVMVTGAGGSIGSEICRQILRFNPKLLVLVGRGENRIFKIERKLGGGRNVGRLTTRIADITDLARMRQLFQQFHPEVVFHAAAHKHVPLMEANVGEAIKNNVLGTKGLADLADEFKVRNFVLISTDKAVHPSSIMGVSKQLAERYVHAMSQLSATRFTVVRFGNVLGSEGSVVPIFQEQIRRGGPITVTDPRMTRFFMTIPEASQLVLQAAAMGNGGEIFVLEMGEPVRIIDLARDLIRLSGLPEQSIEINFTGVRPGEKLYEELYFDEEETLPTSHPKLRAAYHRPYSLPEVREAIACLAQLVHGPEELLRAKLREVVPEYVSPGDNENPPGLVTAALPPSEVATPAAPLPGAIPGDNGPAAVDAAQPRSKS
jgi:FlaA1/EpsC-like NDP-sugar epimerase